MKLSRLLQDWRREQGWSQYQAARELGVTRLTYRTWEMGVSIPSVEHLLTLSKWLGLSIHEILEATGVPVNRHIDACRTCGGSGRAA